MKFLSHLSMLIPALFAVFIATRIGVQKVMKLSLYDTPNERSSHDIPIPRGGGLPIAILTIITAIAILPFAAETSSLLPYIIAASLVAIISWIDDIRTISFAIRLLVHIISGTIIILSCGPWQSFYIPLANTVSLHYWGYLMTILWIVGLTNSFNFMDGIDGIAGGQAVVNGLGWAIAGWFLDIYPLIILGAVISVTSLGFLSYNWPPAKIFMGDVGSTFLGFSFAAFAVCFQPDTKLAFTSIVMVWPFLFDTIFTFIRRLLHRENIFRPHRSHLYQRLVISGLSHKAVATIYLIMAGICVVLSLLVLREVKNSRIICIVAMVGIFAGLWLLVVVREVLAIHRQSRRNTRPK